MALSTLLGHDDHPGEIPGLGPIPATHARAVVADQRRAEWRWAITDAGGRLLFDGITRRRPTGLAATGPRGGIVELHCPRRFSPSSPAAPRPRAGGGAVGRGAGRHRPPVRRTPPARPRRPPRRPAAPRRAAPPHPDSRSLLRRHRMPPSPHPLRPGPHRRVPGRWPDRRRRPGTTLPSRPHPQGPRRLDPPPARPRHLRLDQPTRRPVRDPARTRPAAAPRHLSRAGRSLARRGCAARPGYADHVRTGPTTVTTSTANPNPSTSTRRRPSDRHPARRRQSSCRAARSWSAGAVVFA